ncbi:MAG TPA: hypothetical protein VMY42_27715 [Thermoguttaceae bacterium]|nr:hypothetical protein [Thermoguttaceae bacterium]
MQVLTQERADELMGLPKQCADRSPIEFPLAGEALLLELRSEDGRESFLLDVNRKGRIKLKKCTYQERYAVVEILLRLDLNGPPHENPDGSEIPTPHLHVYREGFADKWAQSVPPKFSNTDDLVGTLGDFLRYCGVQEIPEIQSGVT